MAAIGLLAQFRQYKSYSYAYAFPASIKDGYEFIEHTYLALWLAVGVIFIAIVHISPWWSIVWFLLGGLGAYLFKTLMDACGLSYLVELGAKALKEFQDAKKK